MYFVFSLLCMVGGFIAYLLYLKTTTKINLDIILGLTCLCMTGFFLLSVPDSSKNFRLISQIIIPGPLYLVDNNLVTVPENYTQAKYYNTSVYLLQNNTLIQNNNIYHIFPFKITTFDIGPDGIYASDGFQIYKNTLNVNLIIHQPIIDLLIFKNLLYVALNDRVQIYRNTTLIQEIAPLNPLKITIWKNKLVVAAKTKCIMYEETEQKILTETCLEVFGGDFLYVRVHDLINIYDWKS